jgi:hypothetical protein
MSEDGFSEDLSNQAGWMYADLFLALMVVFLATISFVPVISNKVSSGTQLQTDTSFNYEKVFEKTLNVLYDSFDMVKINADIEEFKIAQGIPLESQIIYVQIVGAFDPALESAENAIARALTFSQLIDRNNPTLLKNASTSLSSSSTMRPSQTTLRFSFATRVNVKTP